MFNCTTHKKTYKSMDWGAFLSSKAMEKLGRKRQINSNDLKNQKRKKNTNLGNYFNKCDRARINSLNVQGIHTNL